MAVGESMTAVPMAICPIQRQQTEQTPNNKRKHLFSCCKAMTGCTAMTSVSMGPPSCKLCSSNCSYPPAVQRVLPWTDLLSGRIRQCANTDLRGRVVPVFPMIESSNECPFAMVPGYIYIFTVNDSTLYQSSSGKNFLAPPI